MLASRGNMAGGIYQRIESDRFRQGALKATRISLTILNVGGQA